jgi:ribosomal protein S18 acetylase RimI-like enzyme
MDRVVRSAAPPRAARVPENTTGAAAERAHLPDTELRTLTRRVVPPGASEPFGAYLFRSDEPGADLGRHIERQVFLEAFSNTPDLLAMEYGPFEASSVFICVVDHLRMLPAGVMRVLLPSPRGFKSLIDIESVWGEPAQRLIERTGLALDLTSTWDIATLAVAPEYRGKATRGLVCMGLYQTLTLAALHCGIGWFVAILDMPVFRMIRWQLRMIFAGYEGVAPMPYLGSVASIPAWCDVNAAEQRLSATDRELHAILVEGVGLEPALGRLDLACADRCVTRRGEMAAGQ